MSSMSGLVPDTFSEEHLRIPQSSQWAIRAAVHNPLARSLAAVAADVWNQVSNQIITDDRPSALADRRSRKATQGRRPMTVKSILSKKGGEVLTIVPTATLETAIAVLAEHRIGALVVLGPDQRVIGILSERDIVRTLAEQGAGALTEPLASVMTRKVVTCGCAETIAEIMEQMTTGKFRHVPVIDADRLVGIVSIGDVVKYRLMEMERESAALRDYIQSA
jgi:CBS domain-containing protein